jgi:dihydroorotate dehydrogenase (NAD+) catalytic subunit
MVWDVCETVSVPVIGMGGISSTEDALEFLMAGAAAIQVGTATFSRPTTMVEVIAGIESYMHANAVTTIDELHIHGGKR